MNNYIIPIDNTKQIVQNYETNSIRNLIYTIRGKQVMLDSDVAMLYHYETKRINETVNRNKERFPENFCFKLTQNELENLRLQIASSRLDNENMWSQIATASKDNKKRNNINKI